MENSVPEGSILLFSDEENGNFELPKAFLRTFQEYTNGIFQDDIQAIQHLPEASIYYWEAWERVLKYAIVRTNRGPYGLLYDGDLWLVPLSEEQITPGVSGDPKLTITKRGIWLSK